MAVLPLEVELRLDVIALGCSAINVVIDRFDRCQPNRERNVARPVEGE